MKAVDPAAKTNDWWIISLRVIDRLIAEGYTGQELVRVVRESYPFGPRSHWPYKEWCLAVRYRLAPLGLAKPLPTSARLSQAKREQQMERLI